MEVAAAGAPRACRADSVGTMTPPAVRVAETHVDPRSSVVALGGSKAVLGGEHPAIEVTAPHAAR